MARFVPSLIGWVFLQLLSWNSYSQQDTLRITGSSYFDQTRTQGLCDYISVKLGMPVEYENIYSSKKMHTELREDKVDIALMNTFQYVFAKSDNIEGIEPLVLLGDASGAAKTYLSYLIVRPDSKLNNLQQVIDQVGLVTVDFAYVASTSGHIVPRMQLATMGVPYPEAQFASVHFSGGHLEAISSVIQNKADAAFVSSDDLINYQLTGKIADNVVKIIWTSEPIIQSPVVIRRSLPAPLRQRLKELFLNLHHDNPELWRHIQQNWGAVDPARFVDAKQADFISLQRAADKVGKLVYFLNYYEERLSQQSQELLEGDKLIESQKTRIDQQTQILDQQIVQIKAQTLSLYLLGIIVLGIVIAAVFVFRINRSKQTLNDALVRKNEELEEVVTDLKVTQDQLIHSEKMASLGLLTAGIAHEINNPVNFIFTGINGLEKNVKALLNVVGEYEKVEFTLADQLNDQLEIIAASRIENRYEAVKLSLAEFTNGIRIGALRTADIVSGLRNFARTDESERTRAHIHDCLDSTLLLLQFRIKQAGVHLIKQYDKNIPEIACYPGPLNQVFMNILTNALQAIDARKDMEYGEIIIQTKQVLDVAQISIHDNGVGIPKDILSKIFDPFFTTKQVGQGTGLGLSITYGIVQKHQGMLEVESQMGKGTTFLIRLPTNLTLT
jgi:phosphate/phosphite/phosphonate ABC transporter binding protein